MGDRSFKFMLADLSKELLEKANLAKADATRSGSDYDKGRQFALYEVISLLTQQAEVFGVELNEIGLSGVDPERDLLGT